MYVCMYVCMSCMYVCHVWMDGWMYAWMSVCMYVRTYECMYTCLSYIYICIYIYLFCNPNGNMNLKQNDMNTEDCLYYNICDATDRWEYICVYTTKYGHTLVHTIYHTQQINTHHMWIINNIGASASTVFVSACASAAPQRHWSY